MRARLVWTHFKMVCIVPFLVREKQGIQTVNLRTLIARIALICTVAGVSACSSIVEGTDQNVTVVTDPAGASCTLSTQDGIVGVVNPTPGSITLEKSKNDVTVTCDKDGYQTAANSLNSSFEGMTFGNLIFGGFVGLAVDASTGAMNKYPNTITIVMAPDQFPSVAARDAFFNQEISKIEADAQAVIANIKEACSDATTCDSRVKAVEISAQQRIADLERERLTARVGG